MAEMSPEAGVTTVEDNKFNNITIGVVVDTNDPQEMGRIRVRVPGFKIRGTKTTTEIFWALYASPFGGSTDKGTRGITDDANSVTSGHVAYGFWGLPKVGAEVIVACIDGDPEHMIWLGCIYGQSLVNTLPHGCYSYNGENKPEGPCSSQGEPIEPLYSSLTKAFTSSKSKVKGAPKNAPRKNFEFRSRGADHTNAGVPSSQANSPSAPNIKKGDDRNVKFTEPDGNQIISNQGYKGSRTEPDLEYPETTGVNRDSQVISLTSPGFHSLALDDSIRNCRIRIRTTCGHQIIMDDTNERIYISTCEGKSWIEIDQKGNIDIFAERNVSVRAQKDINFTADGTFRVHAKGIHLFGNDEVRIGTTGNIHMQANKDIFQSAIGEFHALSTGEMMISTNSGMHLKAGDDILQQGANIHLNGPTPTSADPAKHPWFTNRVPEHEPFARVMMSKEADKDKDNKWVPEFSYNDPKVGRVERGQSLNRNSRWHR